MDSNIIVHIFQGRSDIASQLEGRMLYVSVVSRIELFAWPGPDTGRAKWLDAFLAECRIVELTKPIQEITIDIKKRFKLPMADAMIAADRVDVARCDQLVADVFGLSSADLECVRDTLAMASPSRASALAAQRSPDLLQVESFRARVEEILAPLLAYSGRTLRVRVEPQEVSAPWLVLGVTTSTDVAVPPRGILEEALHLALVEGASRVVFAGGPTSGTVAVGVFRQARYWTLTQARALALALLGDAAAMETLRGAP